MFKPPFKAISLIKQITIIIFLLFSVIRLDSRIYKVGIYQNTPKIFIDKDGNPSGFFVDITNHIANQSGLEIEYVFGSWADNYSKLISGDIDIVADMSYLETRAEEIKFNTVFVLESWIQVFALSTMQIDEIADFEGKRIAVLTDSTQEYYLNNELKREFSFDYSVISVVSYAEMTDIVLTGEADILLADRFYEFAADKPMDILPKPVILRPRGVYYGFNKDIDPIIIEKFDAVLLDIKKDKNSIYYSSYRKWFSKHGFVNFPWFLKIIFIFIPIVILLVLLWNYKLRNSIKRTIEKIKDGEELKSRIFENAHIPMLVMSVDKGVFVDCNKVAHDCFRDSNKNYIIGKSMNDISSESQNSSLSSNEEIKRIINFTIREGVQIVEWEFTRKDNSIWDAEIHLFPFNIRGEQFIQMSLIDCSGRKKALNILYNIIDRNPLALIIIDKDGGVIRFNPQYSRLFGVPETEKLSFIKSFIEYNTDYDWVFDRLKSCESVHISDFLYKYSESEDSVWVKIVAFPLSIRNQIPEQFAFMFEDIEKRKKEESDRDKLQQKLIQSQKMESIGRLAGGIAHDFNNMLTAIIANSELGMMQSDQNNPLHRCFSDIKKAAERSARLTGQLLSFARKQTLVKKVLNLNEAISGVLDMIRRMIGANIQIVWNPSNDIGNVLIAPTQIDQIITNLCVNAKDAINGNGSISISTEAAVLDEDFCSKYDTIFPGDYVLLKVADDGCGMDSEIVHHLYEPFYTTKEFGSGTGLGLSTVYGIVKHNNGFISVNTEKGKGTEFSIYLPVSLEEVNAVSSEENKHLDTGPNNRTILIVEDEPLILATSFAMLKHLGYNPISAMSAHDAIDIIDKESEKIDIILSDINMPEMSGVELYKIINERMPGVKIVLMSGFATDIIEKSGLSTDKVEFIQKPFNIESLASKIKSVLKK